MAGKSISFERTEKDKGEIHYHQIKYLKSCLTYQNLIPGLIIDFRGTGNTWFLHVRDWDGLVNSISKKSFNEVDLLSYSNPFLIDKKKLKVNYRYNITALINSILK